jgi:7-cyano-7-deazaguanine synthase
VTAAAPTAVVLLSGGLDSATCLAIAREEGFAPFALTVAYGQRHAGEIDAARRVAAALGAPHRVVSVDLGSLGGSALTDPSAEVPKDRTDAEIGRGVPSTYVPARNTVLLAVATAAAEAMGARAVYLGVNALDTSGYPDCRPAFLEAFRAVAAAGTRRGAEGDPIEYRAPLLHDTKADVARRATTLGVPVALTLSCYDPAGGLHCGRCDACLLRKRGFSEARLPDPTRYA